MTIKTKMMKWSMLIGCIFYTGLIWVFGGSFWTTLSVFVGLFVWFLVAPIGIWFYEKTVTLSNVFYSQRSLFRRSVDFNNDIVEKIDEHQQKMEEFCRVFPGIALACLDTPLCMILFAVMLFVSVLILLLDWIRLLVIGLVNLCFKITPKTVAWTYVFGVTMGAVVTFLLLSHILVNILIGAYVGGLVWVFVLFWKDGRERKYGNPYFPT